MAKIYPEKAQKQLTPKSKVSADEQSAMRKTVDAIFTATKKTRDQMTRNLNLFEGYLYNKDDAEFSSNDRSDVQFNLIFSIIQATAPMVTDNRPITRVAPRFPFMEKMGIALNNVTKYMWQALDIQMLSYKWVLDAMIFGHGIVKVGYNPTKRFGGECELSLIDPRDWFIAPGYEDPWEAPFCGIRTDKPISWIKSNFPHIKEVTGALNDIDGDKKKKDYKFADVNPADMETTFVTMYEVWVRDDDSYVEISTKEGDDEKTVKEKKFPNGKIMYFSEKQFFGEEAAEAEHGLPPYIILHNYVRPHDATGISEVEMLEGVHKELNLLLKYITEYTRRYHNPNVLVDEFSGIDVDLLKSKWTEGGQVFSWDSAGGTRPYPVQKLDEPDINPQIFNLFGILQSISDEVSGVTDVTKGQVGKQERQSASEIAILLESSHTRTRQRVRNMEWSLKRLYYMLLRLVIQYYDEPKSMSFQEPDGIGYQMYGNSKAQAQDIMQPAPLPERIGKMKEEGIPLTRPEDIEAYQKYQRESEDYSAFMEYFRECGDLDPVFFDFEVEVQTDSMLPMDKQARANLYLRLLQMKAIDPQAVLEFLHIPNADEIVGRMNKQEMAAKGGGQQQQLMKQNPELAKRYLQETGQGGAQ